MYASKRYTVSVFALHAYHGAQHLSDTEFGTLPELYAHIARTIRYSFGHYVYVAYDNAPDPACAKVFLTVHYDPAIGCFWSYEVHELQTTKTEVPTDENGIVIPHIAYRALYVCPRIFMLRRVCDSWIRRHSDAKRPYFAIRRHAAVYSITRGDLRWLTTN